MSRLSDKFNRPDLSPDEWNIWFFKCMLVLVVLLLVLEPVVIVILT